MRELMRRYQIGNVSLVAAGHADADHITGLIPVTVAPEFRTGSGTKRDLTRTSPSTEDPRCNCERGGEGGWATWMGEEETVIESGYFVYAGVPVKIEGTPGGGLIISYFDLRKKVFVADSRFYSRLMHDRDDLTREVSRQDFDRLIARLQGKPPKLHPGYRRWRQGSTPR